MARPKKSVTAAAAQKAAKNEENSNVVEETTKSAEEADIDNTNIPVVSSTTTDVVDNSMESQQRKVPKRKRTGNDEETTTISEVPTVDSPAYPAAKRSKVDPSTIEIMEVESDNDDDDDEIAEEEQEDVDMLTKQEIALDDSVKVSDNFSPMEAAPVAAIPYVFDTEFSRKEVPLQSSFEQVAALPNISLQPPVGVVRPPPQYIPTTTTLDTTSLHSNLPTGVKKIAQVEEVVNGMQHTLKVPQETLAPEVYDDENDEVNQPSSLPRRLRQPRTWFLLFAIPHILFYGFFLSTTVKISNITLSTYKSLLGTKNTINTIPSTTGIMTEELKLLLDDFTAAKASLAQAEEYMKSEVTNQFQLFSEGLAPHIESFSQAELDNKVKNLEESVRQLNNYQSVENSQQEPSNISIQSMQQSIDNKMDLLDVSNLDLWNVTDAKKCLKKTSPNDVVIVNETGAVAHTDIMEHYQDIVNNIAESVQSYMDGSETLQSVKVWVGGLVESFIKEKSAVVSVGNNVEPAPADKLNRLRRFINARLEVEAADFTGRVDYASITNGAFVVRKGPFATSPSVVDKLPLLNRIAHLLWIRFYGYGPEVALTPSYPPASLGQCWAFQKDTSSQSAFGILTVHLARPIYVDSISIEHVLPERSTKFQSAIRSFRIVGFEDANNVSSGSEQIRLGSFEYVIGGESDRIQSFEVVDGGTPKKVSVITLAVDTIWGGDYACLYRFRVHGNEDQDHLL